MTDALFQVLNNQVNAEFYSAYLYLSLSAQAEAEGFLGAANWLHVQAQEEMAHGMHIYQYILDRGALPTFNDIQAPAAVFDCMTTAFQIVLAHEQEVTGLINHIAAIAMGENDFACYNFIGWFVNEQVEEESNADKLLKKAVRIGNDTNLLFALDDELAARVFVNPFPAAQ